MDLDYLSGLGKRILGYLEGTLGWEELSEAIALSEEENPYFTSYMQRYALKTISTHFLDEKKLREWCGNISVLSNTKKIGIVMAGNIPLVGFQDLLCVLVSGAEPVIKLSSKDKRLMPVLFPDLKYCSSQELLAEDIDALITMGGDEAAAFYSKAFPGIPSLIRGSRFSAAVISGSETDRELNSLCEDISLYYGLGCRSVTYLLVNQNFDIQHFAKVMAEKSNTLVTKFSHSFFVKNCAVLTLEGVPFIAAEPFLFVESDEYFLSPGMVGYRRYSSEEEIEEFVKGNRDVIQKIYRNFGIAQCPSPDDYPDGKDTLDFCIKIIHGL